MPVGAPITTLQGDTFTVDAALAITDQRGRTAGIAATDVLASNGVMHVIDKVILPRLNPEPHTLFSFQRSSRAGLSAASLVQLAIACVSAITCAMLL